MPSSDKTSLGLNLWIEDDRPNMEDFNYDNQMLNQILENINAKLAELEAKQ